jgi:hypothetical protein
MPSPRRTRPAAPVSQLIQARPVLAALGSRDTGIVEGGDDLPASGAGDLGELGDLVLDAPSISADWLGSCV